MSRIVIFIIAVSLPLGDQLNAIGLNVSLLYASSIVVATLLLPFIKSKYQIPTVYKVFYIYILLHVIITYLPNTDLLTKTRLIRMFGEDLPQETYGVTLLRYLIYLLSPCVILKYINNRGSFLFFSKVFIYTFLASVTICSVFNIVSSFENRLSGGFHDPNTFGGMSLIALFLSLYLSKCNDKHYKYKYIAVVFIGFILASGSRAATLSLLIGILYLLYRYGLSIKQFVLVCVSITVVVLFIMHSDLYIVERFSNISETSEGNMRTVIWLNYIKSWETYFISGVGAGRVFDIVKESYSMFSTHNQYLLQLVQFGIIGLLLFLRCLYKNIWFFTMYSKINKTLIPIASLQLCSLILLFFSDYDNTRELVILTTFYFIFYNQRKNSATPITLTRKFQSQNDS